MALFCDFENLALGVRDAQYHNHKFDIRPVLERLLLKGSIVVKKAYCDWERYKGFKATMHEANFELIEIPHVRQSGKNSADIRLVVDALDLCYTKAHVDTFVILSGDSDFSPLVSKLRENAKRVIGVGVKGSTSDLLVANCDEFIFYDDLVRESQRAAGRRDAQHQQPGNNAAGAPRGGPQEHERHRRDDLDGRRRRGIEIAVETFEALLAERGESGKIWASVLKEAIKRRRPDFSESNFGFRAFGNLLEEAQSRGLLEFGRDDKSGAYVFRSAASAARAEPASTAFEPLTAESADGYAETVERERHAAEAPAWTSDAETEASGAPEAPETDDGAQEPSAQESPDAPFASEAPTPREQREPREPRRRGGRGRGRKSAPGDEAPPAEASGGGHAEPDEYDEPDEPPPAREDAHLPPSLREPGSRRRARAPMGDDAPPARASRARKTTPAAKRPRKPTGGA